MKRVRVEICCGSAADVLEAARGGADRVELNSALCLGGLTPSLGQLALARRAGLPIMAMVRPREGGFCYSDADFETMLIDARALLDAGAHGIVFGILHADGRVDKTRCQQMLDLVHAYPGRDSVFHRAIDVAADWRRALDELIELGFTRVLSSGRAATALQGVPTLSEMLRIARGRLEILPGAGIRPDNAREILTQTGCTQLHFSMRREVADNSCAGNPAIRFIGDPLREDIYKVTDGDAVRRFIDAINLHGGE